jgi:predicted nucleotide-binding protein
MKKPGKIKKSEFIGVLRSIKNQILTYDNIISNNKSKIMNNKIFIVHGKNDAMKLAVKDLINQLGLEPIILHEQPNKSKTIIEKFEYLSQDIGFAIVILSADDKMKNGFFRARQNVILELGYFVAKLGRDNVIALYENSANKFEYPSDISGILYLKYDEPYGNWRLDFLKELNDTGYNIDANKLLSHKNS